MLRRSLLTTTAIETHGGEILKFIGDGLLAIFPITEEAGEKQAANRALAEACATVRRALTEAMPAGEPPVRMLVALRCGTVIYGNIGAAARLDFTVIAPRTSAGSRPWRRLSICLSWSARHSLASMAAIFAPSVGMNCGVLADRMSSSRPSRRPLCSFDNQTL